MASRSSLITRPFVRCKISGGIRSEGKACLCAGYNNPTPREYQLGGGPVDQTFNAFNGLGIMVSNQLLITSNLFRKCCRVAECKGTR